MGLEKRGKQKEQMREIKIVQSTFQGIKKRHFQEPWNIREVTLSETAGEDEKSHKDIGTFKEFREYDLNVRKNKLGYMTICWNWWLQRSDQGLQGKGGGLEYLQQGMQTEVSKKERIV